MDIVFAEIEARKKTINYTFCGRKWPIWDPFLTQKISPPKFMWVPLLRPLPGNEAHQLFAGGPKLGVYPDPPILAFLEKSKDALKKTRLALSVEPVKSLEKKGKGTRKQGKPQHEKKQGNTKHCKTGDFGHSTPKNLG